MNALNVLVTGASGFVGRALVGELRKTGNTGTAVSRTKIETIENGWRTCHRDSVLKGDSIANALRPDCVVHLEVKQHVENPTAEDLIEFQEVNVVGTEQWLAWCEARGVAKFVYFSTIKAGMPSQRSNGGYVHCGGDVSESDSFGIKEDLLGPGDTPYGKSKWEAEQRVIQWAEKKPDRCALIVRPAVVYGPGNTANIYAMVNALAKVRIPMKADTCSNPYRTAFRD